MNIYLKTFGKIQDLIPEGKIETHSKTTDEFINELLVKHPQLKGNIYRIGINKKIILNAELLNENDELSLLPPFAGG